METKPARQFAESDPIDLALRHVFETRRLLEQLIVSSEQFDYQTAKEALRMLDAKVRELGKFHYQLQQLKKAGPGENIVISEFA